MVKHMLNKKGFTLIEMLMVLFIISIITLLVPPKQMYTKYLLRQKIEYVKTMLLDCQSKAMIEHKQKNINITTNSIECEDQIVSLEPFMCEGISFHYTPTGTISNAQTLHFISSKQSYDIVLQLGSGCADVRS